MRSRGTLQRVEGHRKEQVHLQNSKWNRAGEHVMFNVVLNVRDRQLGAWRRANPDSAVCEGTDDWVCGHPFGSLLDSWLDGQVGLTNPQQRVQRLESFVGKIRQVAIPWFAATADPGLLVSEVPDQTLSSHPSDLVEWLVCRGERDQARALLERWIALEPANPEHLAAGRKLAVQGGERPYPGPGEAAGWAAVRLGLL